MNEIVIAVLASALAGGLGFRAGRAKTRKSAFRYPCPHPDCGYPLPENPLITGYQRLYPQTYNYATGPVYGGEPCGGCGGKVCFNGRNYVRTR